MTATVFRKTMRDQYRSLIGWSIAIFAIAGLEIALWPSMKSMKNLDELLAGYPEEMKELFNIGEMTSGTGFLNAELFSLTIPVMFLIYAIGRGARLTAGEEEAGTYEVLLATPVSRGRILLEKAAALITCVAILGVVLLVVTYGGATLVAMDVGFVALATACLAMTLLGIEFALVALALGASWGKRPRTLAVAGGLAAGAYLLFAATSLVEALEPWRIVSPFYQATEGGPIGAGLPARFAWLVVIGVAAIAAALPVFDRRDIAA